MKNKKMTTIKNLFLILMLAFLFRPAVSQDVLGDGIQDQLKGAEKEFLTPDIDTDSKLFEDLNRPVDDNLLEQMKEMERKQDDVKKEEISEIEDTEEEIDDKDSEKKTLTEEEEEEDELILPLFFGELNTYEQSMIEYYKSISEFFGYHIFLQSISEESENALLPSGSNKIIGPGDEIILTIWGDTKLRYKLEVEKDGSIYIPLVTMLYVHGLTMDELEAKLKKVLPRHFNTIDPPEGNPTTFFEVSYGKLRSIQVLVSGEVNQPGVHEISMNANVLSALIKARGVKAEGTLRDIKIIRNGEVYKSIDMYDFLTTGKSIDDFNLQDNDNVFVGIRQNTISLEGEILKPLKYELLEGEDLSDLIKYAGGATPTSRIDRIKIERITPFEQRGNQITYTNFIDIPLFVTDKSGNMNINKYELKDRDVVTIEPIQRILSSYVSINGSVFASGRYSYENDMTIHDLISKSGGLTADAYIKRAELIRTNSDKTQEYIRLDLANNMDKALNPTDSLNIFSIWDLKSPQLVYLYGYVKRPGYYFLKDSMRVSDLIFTRGGLLDEWRKNRTYTLIAQLTRYDEGESTSHIIDINLDKVMNGDMSEDILLKNGDRLNIKSKYLLNEHRYLSISGYVKNEGEYELETGMKIEDLIYKAGGYREGAYKRKAIVFRTNTKENDKLSIVHEVDIAEDYFENENARKSEFILKGNDHVVIRRDPSYKKPRKVTISGEVKFPGTYTLVNLNDTFTDLIIRAGGLTKESFIEGTFLDRDTLRLVSDFRRVIKDPEKYDIILKEGDDIHIPKRPGTVKVEGYVYTPGLIKYRPDWSIYDYIEAAGGTQVESDYYSGKPIVYYPGGNARIDNGWLNSPEVIEGSRIVVNRIKKEESRDWVRELRNWLALLTSTVTVLLLIENF